MLTTIGRNDEIEETAIVNVHPSCSSKTVIVLSDLAAETVVSKPSKWRQFWSEFLCWKGIRDGLVNGLLRGDEPQIYRKCDRDGNEYFKVYDRVGDRWYRFESESEVRAWIDRRYSG
jgi:hypothetical protein